MCLSPNTVYGPKISLVKYVLCAYLSLKLPLLYLSTAQLCDFLRKGILEFLINHGYVLGSASTHYIQGFDDKDNNILLQCPA